MHDGALQGQNLAMQQIDLPDVVLMSEGPFLVIKHKKTGMRTVITPARLNAWLIRQLRQELVSPKEKT